MKVVISAGHSEKVRGASGYVDEYDENCKIVKAVAEHLHKSGVDVEMFIDTVSTTQQENLDRIVDYHNSFGAHEWDLSIHCNAYVETSSPMGCEVLYVTQSDMADDMSSAIASRTGLIEHGGGAKYRDDLAFLNGTESPAVLVECFFCDSKADVDIYHAKFNELCMAIAETVSGNAPPQTLPQTLFEAAGPCSWFGGPDDTGVDADEGLAFFYAVDDAPHLFLDEQPAGTSGLARRLNPDRPYIACRWDYDVTPKTMLADPHHVVSIYAPKTGRQAYAWPADWGPHSDTSRVADLSPSLLTKLGLTTDDDVEVTYPAKRKK